MTFTMQLRGQMVSVHCNVFSSRGRWQFEQEYVLEYPDWELTPSELANIQQAALCFVEEGT